MDTSLDWSLWVTLGIWMGWGVLLCYLNCHAKHDKPLEENSGDENTEGFVYVVSNNRSFGRGIYKIGMTCRKDPMKRIEELSDASVPFPFEVHALIKTKNAPALEKRLHKLFNAYRVNKQNLKKEFFRLDIRVIQREVEKMGYPWN